MPALWQSSQRPMYVKTVWVDGFRHAILTKDDPYFLRNAKKRRPHSSATCTSKLTTRPRSSRLSHSDDLEGCVRKFNFVIRNDRSFRPKQQPYVEKLDLTDVEIESENDFVVKANPQPLYEFDSCRSKFGSLCLTMRDIKNNRTTRSDVKENNELSERVLQWLDLAGKVDLLAPDNVERMSQPRHSWPEIQRKHNLNKSKTTIDVRAKESGKIATPKSGDSAKAQQSGTIDRHDFYVPASATTIENYARQSRNVRSTPSNEINAKTKDNLKTKSSNVRNIAETRQKVASERNAVEKQYAELLSKKLIPDLKDNKRQVHIFMPELPKKLGSTTTSRTESLLSQFSQLSQKSK